MTTKPIDVAKLSKRQRQISLMVAGGLSNKEIAWRLGLSEGTVKVYLGALFTRLGVLSRLELALGVWMAVVPEACERLAGALSDFVAAGVLPRNG